jgi:hypothetical protein
MNLAPSSTTVAVRATILSRGYMLMYSCVVLSLGKGPKAATSRNEEAKV